MMPRKKKISPIWFERAEKRVMGEAKLLPYRHIILRGSKTENLDHWKWVKRSSTRELIEWAERIEKKIKKKTETPARKVSEDKYGRIISLNFMLQREPRPGDIEAGLKISGFREAQYKLTTVEHQFPVDIPIGPGSNGTQITERVIVRWLNKHTTPGEFETYYVIAEFENSNGKTFFRTITPRTEISKIRLRHL